MAHNHDSCVPQKYLHRLSWMTRTTKLSALNLAWRSNQACCTQKMCVHNSASYVTYFCLSNECNAATASSPFWLVHSSPITCSTRLFPLSSFNAAEIGHCRLCGSIYLIFAPPSLLPSFPSFLRSSLPGLKSLSLTDPSPLECFMAHASLEKTVPGTYRGNFLRRGVPGSERGQMLLY